MIAGTKKEFIAIFNQAHKEFIKCFYKSYETNTTASKRIGQKLWDRMIKNLVTEFALPNRALYWKYPHKN